MGRRGADAGSDLSGFGQATLVAVGGVVERADHDRAAEDVAEVHRDHVFAELRPADVAAAPDGRGDDEHVGDDVLKADGNEDHHRKPGAEDFAAEGVCAVAEPKPHADQPVAANAGDDCLPETGIHFALCDFEGFGEDRAFGETDVVAEEPGDEEGAEDVGRRYYSNPL